MAQVKSRHFFPSRWASEGFYETTYAAAFFTGTWCSTLLYLFPPQVKFLCVCFPDYGSAMATCHKHPAQSLITLSQAIASVLVVQASRSIKTNAKSPKRGVWIVREFLRGAVYKGSSSIQASLRGNFCVARCAVYKGSSSSQASPRPQFPFPPHAHPPTRSNRGAGSHKICETANSTQSPAMTFRPPSSAG